MVQPHFGNDDADALGRVPFLRRPHPPLLDDVVGEQPPGDLFDIRPAEGFPAHAEAFGGVDRFPGLEPVTEQILDGLGRCRARVVPHPRPEPDPDDPLPVDGQRPVGGGLGDRVGEDFLPDALQLPLVEVGIDRQDVHRPDPDRVDSEVGLGFLADAFAFGVDQVLFEGDFQSCGHRAPPVTS